MSSHRLTGWNAIYSEPAPTLSLDITPNDVQINRGHATLFNRVLEAAGLSTRAVAWSIQDFRSSYFRGVRSTKQDLRDRHPLAWRVDLTLAEREDDAASKVPSVPFGIDAVDPTWAETEESWNYRPSPYLVIADFVGARADEVEARVRERPPPRPVSVHLRSLASGVVQARHWIPYVDLAEDEVAPRVVGAWFEALGGHTHWAASQAARPSPPPR